MKKNRFLNILAGIVICLLLFLIGVRLGSRYAFPKHNKEMRKIHETLQLIENNYVDSVSTESLLEGVIPNIFKELDPHSNFLTAEENKKENERLSGHFYGIGITFNTLIDTAVVIRTTPNGPSELVGIKAGDRIIKADTIDLCKKGLSADSVRSILLGPKDSSVHLTVYRPKDAKHHEFDVIRGQVPVPTVTPTFMLNDSLGYMGITSFGSTTFPEFMKESLKLLQNGAKGFVIDLRGNPGGIMFAATAMANEFLDQNNLIVYTEGKNHKRNDFRADGAGSFKNMPLYILLDQFSASSSELFSGAIQDNDRGIIIGRRSFGKGLVQKPFYFKDGSSVYLTIARYYTPSGRCIQKEYKLGDDSSYSDEFLHRLQSGEWFEKDSIHADNGMIYSTSKGRPVYGGGGIIPDVFIGEDTTGITSYYSDVIRKGLTVKYAFNYVDKHRDLLETFENFDQAFSFLKNQGLLYDFAWYAAKNGVPRKSYLIHLSRNILSKNIISQIMSFAYGDDYAARVFSYDDKAIQEAIHLYDNAITSPMLLKSDYQPNTSQRYSYIASIKKEEPEDTAPADSDSTTSFSDE